MSEGILERIEAKLDQLLAGGGAAAGSTTKPKPATKPKEEKPGFTAEQLRDKYLEVQGKFGDAAAKALIAEAGFDKLAKLVADTASWQKSWDLAEAKLGEEVPDDDGGL